MPDKKTVLLIDDDRDLTRGTSLRLRANGFDTVTAYDGREGITTAKQHQPDAILLDVRMPRMNGLKALLQLKDDPRTEEIPIVMLSASLVDQREALESGAKYFITKPYNASNLVSAVERAIANN